MSKIYRSPSSGRKFMKSKAIEVWEGEIKDSLSCQFLLRPLVPSSLSQRTQKKISDDAFRTSSISERWNWREALIRNYVEKWRKELWWNFSSACLKPAWLSFRNQSVFPQNIFNANFKIFSIPIIITITTNSSLREAFEWISVAWKCERLFERSNVENIVTKLRSILIASEYFNCLFRADA